MQRYLALVMLALAAGSVDSLQANTFLQGLAGPNGLMYENSQGSSYRNDRFYTGADKAFIGQSYDWSGVGLCNNGAWATMISPSYFVSANHDHPAAGTAVTFHTDNDPSGPTYTYTVDSWSYQTTYNGHGSDLYIGKLVTPVNDSIAKYPILKLGNDSAYNNMTLWTYGYPQRVGKNNIDSIQNLDLVADGFGYTRVMYFDYDATGGQGFDEAYLEPGDSGSPSFAIWNNSLALLGTHFVNDGAVYNGAPSGDSFIPFYLSQISSHVGEGVTVVPEPATLALLSLGAMFLTARRRTKK